MAPSLGDRSRNVLLTGMDPEDFALLETALEPVQLPFKTVLERPGQPIEFAYFPDDGLLSVVSRFETSRDVEVGVVGREGMSAISLVLNDGRATYATNVQIAGHARRLPADVLRQALDGSRRLQDFLLRFVHAAEIQTASTASANGSAKLEERLARWLLMTHDRIGGDRLDVTHQLLASMLACRRPGVTVALHALDDRGLIRSDRGFVVVLDRKRLEKAANGSYGLAEREYIRLMGRDFRSRSIRRKAPARAIAPEPAR